MGDSQRTVEVRESAEGIAEGKLRWRKAISRDTPRNIEARQNAQILRDEEKRRDYEAVKRRQEARDAELSQVARLRELRLAAETKGILPKPRPAAARASTVAPAKRTRAGGSR